MELNETEKLFVAAMRQAVEERGADFVYPDEWRDGRQSCQYTVDGEGACIIGKVIEIMTGAPYLGSNEEAEEVLGSEFGDELSGTVLRAAGMAQTWQDSRHPWGEALRRFERKLGL